jgi:hypothetical protein
MYHLNYFAGGAGAISRDRRDHFRNARTAPADRDLAAQRCSLLRARATTPFDVTTFRATRSSFGCAPSRSSIDSPADGGTTDRTDDRNATALHTRHMARLRRVWPGRNLRAWLLFEILAVFYGRARGISG